MIPITQVAKQCEMGIQVQLLTHTKLGENSTWVWVAILNISHWQKYSTITRQPLLRLGFVNDNMLNKSGSTKFTPNVIKNPLSSLCVFGLMNIFGRLTDHAFVSYGNVSNVWLKRQYQSILTKNMYDVSDVTDVWSFPWKVLSPGDDNSKSIKTVVTHSVLPHFVHSFISLQ